MRKTYKFRAYILKETESNAKRCLSDLCFLYNFLLETKINTHMSKHELQSCLPYLKNEFNLKYINSQMIQNVNNRLHESFKGFFRRVKSKEKAGFPRFKGINRYDSFTLTQTGYTLTGNKLYIKNIGTFNIRKHREIQGDIKTITVRRSLTNKWYVSFSCDNIPERIIPKTNNSVGLDLGIINFIVDSYGNKVVNPRYLKKSKEILERRQQSLSRKNKGSKRRAKARLLVAKAHEKIANQRLDFLHKLSTEYITNYDIICVEDLKVKNMINGKYNLNASIHDVSWSRFLELLTYKAEGAGREIIKANPKNTSRICSGCGKIEKKELSERVHRCSCGLILDRDHNAAINIHKQGLELGTSSHEDVNIQVQMPRMLASR